VFIRKVEHRGYHACELPDEIAPGEGVPFWLLYASFDDAGCPLIHLLVGKEEIAVQMAQGAGPDIQINVVIRCGTGDLIECDDGIVRQIVLSEAQEGLLGNGVAIITDQSTKLTEPH
jgi:hypothetical protein